MGTKRGAPKKKLTKFTMRLDAKERAALERKATSARLSAAELLRRFILGIAAALLVACGGETFTAQPPGGSAGMSSVGGSGGMQSSAGAGGTSVGEGHRCNAEVVCDAGLFCDDDGECSLQSDIGGACSASGECVSGRCVESKCAEPVAPYDGPAWVECADGVLTARGFEAQLSEMQVIVAVERWGAEYSIRPSCSIDGEHSLTASHPVWGIQNEGSLTVFTSHFDEAAGAQEDPSIPVFIPDATLSKSSTLTCDFQWAAPIGSDADPPFGMAQMVRCLASVPGLEVVGAIH